MIVYLYHKVLTLHAVLQVLSIRVIAPVHTVPLEPGGLLGEEEHVLVLQRALGDLMVFNGLLMLLY